MAKIRWTPEAEKWLREIYEYIAQDNRDAAKRVVEGIYNKIQLLKDFPQIGYKYRSESEGEIRILLYGHYRIAYLIRKEDIIDILGIFHGAMDLDRYLKILS
jgi:addiction module RelE/StbE family toxin